jgi:hypothetical protein
MLGKATMESHTKFDALTRWIAVPLVAFLAAWIAWIVADKGSYLISALNGENTRSLLFRFGTECIAGGVMGSAFIYVSAFIAPTHKKECARVMAVLGILGLLCLLDAAIRKNDNWAILSGITTATGIVVVTREILSGAIQTDTDDTLALNVARIVVGITICCGIVYLVSQNNISTLPDSKSTSSQSDKEIDYLLPYRIVDAKNFADDYKLPLTIDQHIRLDSITLEGYHLVLSHTLLADMMRGINYQYINTFYSANMTTYTCKSEKLRKVLQDDGYVDFTIHASDGSYLTNVEVNAGQCGIQNTYSFIAKGWRPDDDYWRPH